MSLQSLVCFGDDGDLDLAYHHSCVHCRKADHHDTGVAYTAAERHRNDLDVDLALEYGVLLDMKGLSPDLEMAKCSQLD